MQGVGLSACQLSKAIFVGIRSHYLPAKESSHSGTAGRLLLVVSYAGIATPAFSSQRLMPHLGWVAVIRSDWKIDGAENLPK
jgi:hypothetical protein